MYENSFRQVPHPSRLFQSNLRRFKTSDRFNLTANEHLLAGLGYKKAPLGPQLLGETNIKKMAHTYSRPDQLCPNGVLAKSSDRFLGDLSRTVWNPYPHTK